MNNRLLALYAALQGGTRRKPTYRNIGALVSWVYPVKLSDTAGFEYTNDTINLADTTFETPQIDQAIFGYSLNSLVLLDPLITFPNNVNDTTIFNYALNSLILLDIVKVVDSSDGSVDTVAFGYVLNTGMSLVDNVKVMGTVEDAAAFSYQLNSLSLEAS